jgi:hypothetical protein
MYIPDYDSVYLVFSSVFHPTSDISLHRGEPTLRADSVEKSFLAKNPFFQRRWFGDDLHVSACICAFQNC